MGNALLSIEAVLSRLSSVKASGDNWIAKCPAHEDSTASLSVSTGHEGRILFRCFAGCDFRAITTALGLTIGDVTPARPSTRKTIVTTYDYRDLDGMLRYQVVRMDPKDFRQRRPDVNGGWVWDMRGVSRIPYRLDALSGQVFVYITEGEKDADALIERGLPATTNVGGAGKWRDSDSEVLRSLGVQKCALLPDNDVPGRKHMKAVQDSLKAAGIAAVLVELEEVPIKGDVSDWIKSGHSVEELEARAKRKLFVVPTNGAVPVEIPIDPALDPARWARSDLGAAEAFVHRDGDNIRFDHAQERWLIWDQHLWRPDAHGLVYRQSLAHIRTWQHEVIERVKNKQERESLMDYLFKLERRAGIENTIAIAKMLLPVADQGETWDKEPWLLGVANGVIDLKTGQLRDGLRDDRITLQTPTTFDPLAACPIWENFLREVFESDSEIIGYVRRALGYSLTGDMSEQCFFMCIGAGSNGKSTFLNALDAVWGKYAYTTDMRTFTTNQQSGDQGFDLAELANRRLILASETKSDSRLNEQALKNFTGGEKINAARKYGHPFEYTPTGKIWMGLNHQPRVKDDSFGFWRRVRIIPFLRIFSGSAANPKLRAELAAEAPGILKWAVDGCLEWQRDGLNQPLKIMNATDSYRDAEDPLADFLLERTTPDTGSEVSAAALYKNYVEYAREQGLSTMETMSSNKFGRSLSRRFEKKKTEYGARYLGLRVTVRVKDMLN